MAKLFVVNTATNQRLGPFDSLADAASAKSNQVRLWQCGAGHSTQGGQRSVRLMHRGYSRGEVWIEGRNRWDASRT